MNISKTNIKYISQFLNIPVEIYVVKFEFAYRYIGLMQRYKDNITSDLRNRLTCMTSVNECGVLRVRRVKLLFYTIWHPYRYCYTHVTMRENILLVFNFLTING